MTRQVLTEATTTATATPVDGQPGRFLVQLISPGWGSSGYYAAEVLKAAAAARVFPAGLHMYLDHPTATEQYDRPERTVRDLAAVLEEDATWNGDALVATATVFGAHRQVLEQMADAIGVSIRAAAEVSPGEAEGRQGLIVTELVEGISADFVTHAGRGGKILQVIESARSRVDEATANDTRAALEQALTDTFGGERQWVGVRDFDESTVWFWQSSPDHEALYQLAYSIDDQGVVSLSGQPVEVRARTVYVPVNQPAGEAATNVPATRPGSSTTTTTEESEEDTMPEIEEARLRQLEEDAGRVQALESERDTAVRERDEAREALAARDRADAVARVLGEAVEAAGVELNQFERAGVAARAVVTDGAVDEAATRTAFDTALASIAESRGAGRPRGLGGSIRATESAATVEEALADLDNLAGQVFGTTRQEA